MGQFFLKRALGAAALALVLASTQGVQAEQLISNGSFEMGFSDWTVLNQTGSAGNWFLQTGTTSPDGPPTFTVPAPPEGSFAAMTAGPSAGSHVLYQDFVVPVEGITAATFSFERFIGNRNSAGAFSTPNTLDFNVFPNQQARVDIITTTANPFSVASGDVLLNLFQTMVGDPPVSGYTLQTNDLTSFLAGRAGQTLRLRFAEVDNQSPFQFGVDSVSLQVTPIPEPASLVLMGLGGLGLLVYGWRGRKAAKS
ncbi:MAG: PEP-CTERM sorting domain-containing protein [Isosphaeraceae bacterium]|nr:PEP-CTERM sorting domain-containing protein [Isosphaeraceae bacterium]